MNWSDGKQNREQPLFSRPYHIWSIRDISNSSWRYLQLELKISSTELKISSIELEISSTELKISLTELEISSTELKISTTELEISLIGSELKISSTELEISLIQLKISLIQLKISLTQLKISLTELEISLTELEISSNNWRYLDIWIKNHFGFPYKWFTTFMFYFLFTLTWDEFGQNLQRNSCLHKGLIPRT